MNKKLIIIMAALGLMSFSLAFIFAWFTKKAPPPAPAQPKQSASADESTDLQFLSTETNAPGVATMADAASKRAMTEKQLKDLVYEVRLKMQEYDNKLRSLQVREQRSQMAQEILRQDIENLNNLRTELASAVATLKSERDKLEKTRIEISKTEKLNLVSIAATYDKMDAASASKILSNMCSSPLETGGVTGADTYIADAVKILYYMTERTKAKLLSELVTTEPKLAAILSQKLKQVVEK